MTNPARPEKDRIEFVLVFLKEPETASDDVDFRKGQERVEADAGQEKEEGGGSGIQDPGRERRRASQI